MAAPARTPEAFATLVVDDDRLARRIVADALRAAGHTVNTAADGAEALRLVGRQGVDLVVTDWQMPELDGVELTRALRELADGGPSVIVVTGVAPDKGALALEAGADDFLVKPVRHDELVLRAERAIADRRRRRDLARQQRRMERERAARRAAEHLGEQTMGRLRDTLRSQRRTTLMYESILASAGEGIYGVDLQGHATFVNEAACRMLGVEPAEMIGQPTHELLHHSYPDGRPFPAHHCPMLAALESGEVRRADGEFFWRKDGSGFPVDYTTSPIRDNGRIAGAVVVFADISSRVAVERELHAQHARLLEQQAEAEAQNENLRQQQAQLEDYTAELESQQQELQGSNEQIAAEKARVERFYAFAQALVGSGDEPAALADDALQRLCDASGALVGALYLAPEHEAVPSLVSTRGLVQEDLPGRLDEDAGLAGRALNELRPVGTAHAEGRLSVESFGRRVHLGRELHLPLRIADRAVGVASLGWTDDAPLGEEDLRALETLAAQAAPGLANALSFREARQRAAVVRAVLDATPDGIRLDDPDGRVKFANMAAVDFSASIGNDLAVGSSARSLGERVAELTRDPGAYLGSLEAIAAEPLRKRVDEIELVESGRFLRRYTAPVTGADGELLGKISVLRDITEERRAERMKDEIVATVSHELRTPLTSIIGYAELLAEDAANKLDPDERHMLDVVERNARRLLGLVGDLHVVAQSEARELELLAGDCDLARIAAVCVDDARPIADERQIELTLEAEDPVPVVGDSDRLGQAITNLLSNALKFTPPGGSVLVRVGALETIARVEVADSGVGIAPAEVEHLFERFFRGAHAEGDHVPGSGLGLAVTRAIVDAHGGTIAVQSTEGEGTAMTVELPLAPRPIATDMKGSIR